MKTKLAFYALILLLTLCFAFFGTNKSEETSSNQDLFGDKVVETATTYRLYGLKELTPFSWDTAYFFAPYTSTEYISQKTGGKLTDIPALETEVMMAIVFMDQGEVVYNSFDLWDKFYISSSREVLYAKDDPKFILKYIYDSHGPFLYWFDESLVEYETALRAPESLVGPWEYRDAQKWVSLTLTEEGIADGTINYSFEDEAEKESLGMGSINFAGQWDGTVIHCNMYDAGFMQYSNTKDISFPLESFDIVLRDEGFEYDIALMVPMLDRSLASIEGLCRLQKME